VRHYLGPRLESPSDGSHAANDLFVRREDAARFLANVRADEPELADRLRIQPVDLDGPSA
jgi:hypothetical protein